MSNAFGPLRALTGLIAVATLGCSTPLFGREAQTTTGDLETLLAREAELPPLRDVAAPDGSFRARIAGNLSGGFEGANEDLYGVFDIGTSAPVECIIYSESKDAAASLMHSSASYFAELEATATDLQKQLIGVHAAVAGKRPYLGVDWLYATAGVAYHWKSRFGNTDERALYCIHGETGYSDTFDGFFASFLGSLESGDPSPPPQFEEVSVLRIGEMSVGYQALRMDIDSDGDYGIRIRASMLLPNGRDSLIASEDFVQEWSRPDGTLISQNSVSSDGSVVNQIGLRQSEEGWQVRGELQQKPVEATFTSASPLLSTLGEYRLMQSAARGDLAAEVRYKRWLGTIKPEAPAEHLLTNNGDGSIGVRSGPISISAQVDEQGARSTRIAMGRITMDAERRYVDGAF